MSEMVFLPYPKTVRARQAEIFFGVKRDQLNRWVAERRVIAYCEDRAIFYDFASIYDAIQGLPRVGEGGRGHDADDATREDAQ